METSKTLFLVFLILALAMRFPETFAQTESESEEESK